MERTDYIRIEERNPKTGEDIHGIDTRGRDHYCFLSRCGEWRCSLTGYRLIVNIAKWRYV
jgi:hypothetical protein